MLQTGRMEGCFFIIFLIFGIVASWSPHQVILKEWAPKKESTRSQPINQMETSSNSELAVVPSIVTTQIDTTLPTKSTKGLFSSLFVSRRKSEKMKIANAHKSAIQREERLRLDAIQLANQLKYKPVYVEGWESALIKAVRNTDAGISMSEALKQEVNQLIARLSLAAATRTPIPLEDQRLFGKYEVSYVGTGSSQRGNPAGGKYRSKFGRLFYRNDGLYQHILADENKQETIVLNYIRGTLLSFIPFAVILKGIATSLREEERTNVTKKFGQVLSPSTVQADFLPPLIVLGNLASKWPWKGFCFTAGPKSNVILGRYMLFLSIPAFAIFLLRYSCF